MTDPVAQARRLGPLSLIDASNLALLLALLAIAAVGVRSAAAWLPLLGFWLGAILLTWVGVRLRAVPSRLVGWRAAALFVQPIAVLFLLFQSLFVLIPAVRAERYDDVFAAADRWLLGVDATLWMEQWNTRWLDELFHVSYFLYFPMPLVALVWLFWRGRRADVEP
ncbi:MAG: hypothetical protein FJ265_21860, partial [Planctomycetes bacterium]|nr:hypothetical protein [Planctomycetota bacterium]